MAQTLYNLELTSDELLALMAAVVVSGIGIKRAKKKNAATAMVLYDGIFEKLKALLEGK
jgi:hypothetical protein